MADQSSTLKVEDLEDGKRYRFTRVYDGVWKGGLLFSDSGRTYTPGAMSHIATETIEKLPDPEPKWVHGSVVRFNSYKLPFIYDADKEVWRWPGGIPTSADVSRAWRGGILEVLYQPGE